MKMRTVLIIILLGGLIIMTGCLFQSIPRAEFTSTPASGYPPLDVHFDASASRSPNGPILSYDWDFDDGEESSGVTVDHTFTEKGIYRVALTVTDSEGEVGTLWRNVQALSLPPVAIFDYSPPYPTKQTPVEFDARDSYDPDGEIVEWIWSFGDGTSGWGEFTEHIFPTAGITYSVTLTVIDDDNVSSAITKPVRIVGCESCGS